jgi:hypothetical protein
MEISPTPPTSAPSPPADFKDVVPLLRRGHRVPHLLQDAEDLLALHAATRGDVSMWLKKPKRCRKNMKKWDLDGL